MLRHTLAWIASGFFLAATTTLLFAQQQHMMGAMSDDKLIISAMKAAPPAVAKHATIIAVLADGQIRTVRKGTNAFTCMADNPETPGPDPMCMDPNALEWAVAWLKHQDPPQGKVGFMYMLAGGTDASNTDPYATKPDAGNNWVKTGPHVMIVGGKGLVSDYPREAAPDATQPYVMWPGTAYEHLMLPVAAPTARTATR